MRQPTPASAEVAGAAAAAVVAVVAETAAAVSADDSGSWRPVQPRWAWRNAVPACGWRRAAVQDALPGGRLPEGEKKRPTKPGGASRATSTRLAHCAARQLHAALWKLSNACTQSQ